MHFETAGGKPNNLKKKQFSLPAEPWFSVVSVHLTTTAVCAASAPSVAAFSQRLLLTCSSTFPLLRPSCL